MARKPNQRFRSSCLLAITPAQLREQAVADLQSGVAGNPELEEYEVAIHSLPDEGDEIEVEVSVNAVGFAEAEKKVDQFIDQLFASLPRNSEEQISRGSNLLMSA